MRKLLIYGDSNSYGTAPMQDLGMDSRHPPGVRWGDVLAGELGEKWNVVIEGLGGRTAVLDDPIEGEYRNGLRILPAILHSHKPIDLMIVCLGTNDQKMRFGLGTEDVALGVGRLVHEAMLTGTVAQAMIICPPIVRERGCLAGMFSGAEERCAGLSGHMARIALSEGAAFFDAGTVMEVDELDGVHWSAEAHASLGRAVAVDVKALV